MRSQSCSAPVGRPILQCRTHARIKVFEGKHGPNPRFAPVHNRPSSLPKNIGAHVGLHAVIYTDRDRLNFPMIHLFGVLIFTFPPLSAVRA